MRRLDEDGPGALVQLRTPAPIHRMPDFVRAVVQELRTLCPSFGKVRISQLLARAGLALSASTAGRLLRRPPAATPPEPPSPPAAAHAGDGAGATASAGPRAEAGSDAVTEPPPPARKRRVTARFPHHLWHADLTVVPTALGFWVPWLPFAIAQRWPFGAWVAIVLDHFSRTVVARAVFHKEPTSAEVCSVLDRAVSAAGTAPRHLVTDQGTQFRDEYRAWCKGNGVRPRYGAVGQQGSVALIERFIRSMKDECFRRIVVPMTLTGIEQEIDAYLGWYHGFRPHQGLGGRTPAEVLAGARAPTEPADANAEDTAHPRAPPERPCSKRPLRLVVHHHEGRSHLPVVELRPAA